MENAEALTASKVERVDATENSEPEKIYANRSTPVKS